MIILTYTFEHASERAHLTKFHEKVQILFILKRADEFHKVGVFRKLKSYITLSVNSLNFPIPLNMFFSQDFQCISFSVQFALNEINTAICPTTDCLFEIKLVFADVSMLLGLSLWVVRRSYRKTVFLFLLCLWVLGIVCYFKSIYWLLIFKLAFLFRRFGNLSNLCSRFTWARVLLLKRSSTVLISLGVTGIFFMGFWLLKCFLNRVLFFNFGAWV